ncbi:hypothetical protein L798_01683 [Zootermopsis nevadensis]|uniref:Uncharacterized protein n=1 Tax=Zootermopsis nevadensis TaxID=136037 RepID=A0A067RCD1_ZOONE|nr:hypothetical protein L798_01683 [Zootermopsis nevadensis]
MCGWVSLLCVDKYREQQWVPDEEDRCIVTHQIPDTIFCIKLQSKASRISAGVSRPTFTAYSGESYSNRRLLANV